ncbi:ATP-binding protein [Lentzea indica]|uniref:ATP-binding protein n=1 Tax=Lentzea indica TaxID=2604800 RepID=UPI00143C6BF9|nr:NB-ARC domain-containing protein [Lentzea indica]
MRESHLASLRHLVTRAEAACDETQRAAALAELQRVGASALRDAVSEARDSGVSWRILASELRMAATTLHSQFASGRAVLARAGQPSPRRLTLPAPFVDEFVGRQRELSDLRRLMSRARVVTLTGTGGIGKTRLTGEFVHRTGETFRDVWWVELAPLSDGGHVDAAVAAALGGEAGEMIAEACRSGPCLLVLDNCEHVVDACARLVSRLLAVSDGLRVLATSREQLGVPGEQVFAVASLPVDPAVRLFTERAQAAVPGFGLTDEQAAAVADLCLRLDGLPLAIELAARQVAMLPPEELLACLDERLALLSGGPRTAPTRHQSLHAAIEWSYDLLSDTEQAVFRRLTVFADSFERQDAAAVCSDLELPDRTLWTVLTGLVAKSLVVANGQRLRVLESLRMFGHAQLTRCDEWTAAVDRLVDRLVLFAVLPPPVGMTREERRIKRRQHRHNLEFAVPLATPTDDERYANLLSALTRVRRQQLSFQSSLELLENALIRQRSAMGRVVLLVELCDHMVGDGEYASAREFGEQAVALAEECGAPWAKHWAVQGLTFACGRLGDQAAMNVLLPQLVSAHGSSDSRTPWPKLCRIWRGTCCCADISTTPG